MLGRRLQAFWAFSTRTRNCILCNSAIAFDVRLVVGSIKSSFRSVGCLLTRPCVSGLCVPLSPLQYLLSIFVLYFPSLCIVCFSMHGCGSDCSVPDVAKLQQMILIM